MQKLNWREERTLLAFEEQAEPRFCDLPPYIGRKTMDALIEKGLVEVVDNKAGEYAKDRRWRQMRADVGR